MRYEYCVQEVSDVAWQEIMDSDELDPANQHLNKWGKQGWQVVCVVPKLESGSTVGYGIVFKREIADDAEPKGCGK
jgi:hypothetical protein